MKFKPYQAIEVTKRGATVKDTVLTIASLLGSLASGLSVKEIADDYSIGESTVKEALKELSNNLIYETPMKVQLTIETATGPVTVEDNIYGTPTLAEFVKLSTSMTRQASHEGMKEHTWVRVIEVTEPAGVVWKCTACTISVWSLVCPSVSSFLDEEPHLIRYVQGYVQAGDVLNERASRLPVDCNEVIALGIIEK